MHIGIEEARPPYVSFETRAEEDRQASIEAGRKVYKNVDYALITPQGSRDRIERVAEEWLQKIFMESQGRDPRFPPPWVRYYREQYEAFKDQKEVPLNGTALSEWPSVSPAQIKNFHSINVRTVEDIATANEETLGRMGMGARDLKRRAQNWLEAASGSSKVAEQVSALQMENEGLKARNKELDETLTQLSQRLAFLEANGGRQIQPPFQGNEQSSDDDVDFN